MLYTASILERTLQMQFYSHSGQEKKYSGIGLTKEEKLTKAEKKI